MSILETVTGTRPCLECKTEAEPTEWKPTPGLDPCMRQFECPNCHRKFFLIIKTAKQLMIVGQRVKALCDLRKILAG